MHEGLMAAAAGQAMDPRYDRAKSLRGLDDGPMPDDSRPQAVQIVDSLGQLISFTEELANRFERIESQLVGSRAEVKPVPGNGTQPRLPEQVGMFRGLEYGLKELAMNHERLRIAAQRIERALGL